MYYLKERIKKIKEDLKYRPQKNIDMK
jgi:hypothetical protein